MIKKDKEILLEFKGKQYYCPVELTLDLIGGKWKGVIIWYLRNESLRYSELRKKITTISEKVLIKELKILKKNGIVKRKAFPVVPPKVVYSLTPYGKTLVPIFQAISAWGINHVDQYGKRIEV